MMSGKVGSSEGADKKPRTFVLSDESLNSYGFWVVTSGIDLSQFKKNPVMFYNHDRSTLPIGRWDNIRVEGTQLLAEPLFDMNDKFAAEIARKHEEGFINMCSVGLNAKEFSDDKKHIKPGQRYSTITKSKLREVSICDIGSNDNSLALYDEKGKIINLSDGGNNPLKQLRVKKMKVNEILNLADDASDEAVELAIKAIVKERNEYKAEVKRLNDVEADRKKERAVALVDAAIKSGKMTADMKETYLKLFDNDFDSTEKVLEGLSEKTSLAAMSTAGVGYTDPILNLSWDELDKANKLYLLKSKHPDVYDKKFEEKFKK